MGKKSVTFLVKTFFFWSSPEFKKCFIFGEDLFFGLHLICSTEQNRVKVHPPNVENIGHNRGKIANYPPECSTKIGTPIC